MPGPATDGCVGSAALPGELANLDLASLRNGVYELELIAVNAFDEARDRVRFSINSQLKLGQFTFSEQDLVIPAGGLPIAIVRTYDSFNLDSGQLGYSWALAINDIQMEIDEEREDVVPVDGAEPISRRVGGNRNITLTLPSGERATFAYDWRVRPATGLERPTRNLLHARSD